jgi:F-type H+-transporting ATPase subunit b
VLVVVSQAGARPEVLRVVFQQEDESGTETGTEAAEEPPNPILPTGKEIVWTVVTFFLLLVLMRYWLYPRLKKGMDARYARIRSKLEAADSTRAGAEAELAQYQTAVAQVRDEANQRIDVARQQLDVERSARTTAVNAELGEQRAAAAAAADDARRAALAQVEGAVAEVATNAAERALGAPVDAEVARTAAADAVREGVAT